MGTNKLKALRVDRSKIVDYLLSRENSRGKAAFFFRMGFRLDQWEVLAHALKSQALAGGEVRGIESSYGTRYSVDGVLETPKPRSSDPRIRTVWIEEYDDNEWRLITAYPL